MQKGSKLINSLAGQPCLLVFIIPNMKHQVHFFNFHNSDHATASSHFLDTVCINNDNDKIINTLMRQCTCIILLHYIIIMAQCRGWVL